MKAWLLLLAGKTQAATFLMILLLVLLAVEEVEAAATSIRPTLLSAQAGGRLTGELGHANQRLIPTARVKVLVVVAEEPIAS